MTESAPPTHHPYREDTPFVACAPSDLSLFESAKIKYEFAQELPVSPDTLFDVLEDPGSWPRWATGIGRVDWTSPKPFGVGTTRTVTFWGGMSVYEEFLVWERGKEMAFVFYGTTEEVWSRFGEYYRVEDLGENRCRLTWTVAFDPTGGFGRFYPLFGWIMRFNLRSYLWRLKGYCRRNT